VKVLANRGDYCYKKNRKLVAGMGVSYAISGNCGDPHSEGTFSQKDFLLEDPIKTLGCLRLDDMAEFYSFNP